MFLLMFIMSAASKAEQHMLIKKNAAVLVFVNDSTWMIHLPFACEIITWQNILIAFFSLMYQQKFNQHQHLLCLLATLKENFQFHLPANLNSPTEFWCFSILSV